MTTRVGILALASLLLAGAAHAHHSGAIFEPERTITLSGTVREFQWTNPHCWIQLTVPAAAARPGQPPRAAAVAK